MPFAVGVDAPAAGRLDDAADASERHIERPAVRQFLGIGFAHAEEQFEVFAIVERVLQSIGW
jgi:hypothetical protein